MKTPMILAATSILLTGTAQASDTLADHLYGGKAKPGISAAKQECAAGKSEACFALGMFELVHAYENLAASFYRHGAVLPTGAPLSLVLGMDNPGNATPANPSPEPLSYDQLRDLLNSFVLQLDSAKAFIRESGRIRRLCHHHRPAPDPHGPRRKWRTQRRRNARRATGVIRSSL